MAVSEQGHRSGLRNPRSATLATDRERQVQKLLEGEGWVVFDVRGRRLGGKNQRHVTSGTTVCDFVAMRAGGNPDVVLWDGKMCAPPTNVLLIEVKSTERSPWVAFSKEPRRALIEVADRVRATAVLAWWPPGGECEWIPSSDWPKL